MTPPDDAAALFASPPFDALDALADERAFTLRTPVTFAGVTTSVVRVAEPTAANYETIAGMTGMESYFWLIFLASGLPLGAAERLGSRDYNDIRDFLDGFAPAMPAPPDADALPSPATLALRRPLSDPQSDVPTTSLRLREPTAGERRKVEGLGGTAATIELIALVSGVSRATVAKLPARDFRKGALYLMGFINGGRATGAAV